MHFVINFTDEMNYHTSIGQGVLASSHILSSFFGNTNNQT
jgi:hypothetical protein